MGTAAYVKNVVHSRRFREFCSQMLNEEIDNCCTELLQELVKFQDRTYHKDPSKAKLKRRFVLGIRELTKHLKLNHIKCVIVAPNLEKSKTTGGLDERVQLIIDVCKEKDIPCIFSLDRRKLGKICKKPVPASAIGIFSYDGANETYKNLLKLSEQAREAYSLMLKVVAADLNHINDNKILEVSLEMDGKSNGINNSIISYSTEQLNELSSKIQTLLDDDTRILKFEDGIKYEKSSDDEKQLSRKKTVVSTPIEGTNGSPYPELDHFIHCEVSSRIPPGYIRKWTYFSKGEIMVYDVGHNRYCERIGRNHSSNNIMILADLRRKVYYQKCHDPECRAVGYKSQEYSLPEDALPYHIIFETDPSDFDFDIHSEQYVDNVSSHYLENRDIAYKSNSDLSTESQIVDYSNFNEVDDLEDSKLINSKLLTCNDFHEVDDLEDCDLIAAENLSSQLSNNSSDCIGTWF